MIEDDYREGDLLQVRFSALTVDNSKNRAVGVKMVGSGRTGRLG